MRRLFRTILRLCLLTVILLMGYGYTGYHAARVETPELLRKAEALIAEGRGGVALGVDRRAMLLAVRDPAFGSHYGMDFTTPGAGSLTITQSLAQTDGFADLSAGLRRIRQTGYAIAIERALTKPQILALYLDVVPMGAGPDGARIDGLFAASKAHFDAPPSHISEDDFLALVAVMIAPNDLSLADRGPALHTRMDRISRLLAGACTPNGHHDIWLEACSAI